MTSEHRLKRWFHNYLKHQTSHLTRESTLKFFIDIATFLSEITPMPRQKNLQFDFVSTPTRSDFGGSLLKNSHAKGRRPFSPSKTLHVVLRSSLAKGSFSLRHPKNLLKVKKIIETQAVKAQVKLYRFANSGNHLHLLVYAKRKTDVSAFLRSISGLIARLILKSERGSALPEGVRFWDQRPFSRIVSWGKDFTRVAAYILQNTLEALGFIAYAPRRGDGFT